MKSKLGGLRQSLIGFLTLTVIGLSSAAEAQNFKDDVARGMADGPGIWANIWNYPSGDLDAYCKNLQAKGIRNLFIQTSRSNTPAVRHPEKLGPLIDACHRYGVRVIGWSFAELLDPQADAAKMIEAAQFRSAGGGRLDAVAPNLEKNLEPWRIEKYSKQVRASLGANYPMVAVVYSPLNRCFEVARIPWKTLAKYYDAIAPMCYWNSKYQKLDPHEYTVETVRRIRELTGKPDIEIHAIGDAMGTKKDSIHSFLKGCKVSEVTGVSLYPNQQMTEEQLEALSRTPDYLPSNARFRLAAFRDLLSGGHIDSPPGFNPASPISRHDFYKLLVRNLHPSFARSKGPAPGHGPSNAQTSRFESHLPLSLDCKNTDGKGAHDILIRLGLVADMSDIASQDEVLSSPIYPDEAISLIAQIISYDRSRSGFEARKRMERRTDRWLVPPAQAKVLEAKVDGRRPLNFLDASQMVLQAQSGLN